jgi:Leucine-rich repeat (LRR) protein
LILCGTRLFNERIFRYTDKLTCCDENPLVLLNVHVFRAISSLRLHWGRKEGRSELQFEKMTSLRHLFLIGCRLLRTMPIFFFSLSTLELNNCRFGSEHRLDLSHLECLRNLAITHCRFSSGLEPALPHSLTKLEVGTNHGPEDAELMPAGLDELDFDVANLLQQPFLQDLALDGCLMLGAIPASPQLALLKRLFLKPCYAQYGNLVVPLHFLSSLEGLEELEMMDIVIPEEEIQYLPTSLTKIICSNNGHMEGPRLNVRHLTRLVDLSLTRLADPLAPASLPSSVKKLHVNSAYQASADRLDFAHMTQLESLILTNCQLTSSLENLPPSLTELRIQSCRGVAVGILDFTHLAALTELTVDHSGLTTLPLTPPSLRKLYLSLNNFSAMPLDFSHLTQLTQLLLERCELTYVCITSMPASITCLDLSRNGSLDPAPSFRHLVSLEMLRLGACKMIGVPAGLSCTIRKLDLSRNPLSNEASLKYLAQLVSLEYLDLSGCGLIDLPTPFLPPSLTEINLDGNNGLHLCFRLDFSHLTRLKILAARRCGLSRPPFLPRSVEIVAFPGNGFKVDVHYFAELPFLKQAFCVLDQPEPTLRPSHPDLVLRVLPGLVLTRYS